MPIRLYDFECPNCEKVYEAFADVDETTQECKFCGHEAKRIISIGSSVYLGNDSAVWTRSVLEVVDKENPARHVQEFVKNPNRSTYKAWMKGEGLRPMDSNVNGAPPVYKKPPPPDTSRLRREVAERHMQRRRIEI